MAAAQGLPPARARGWLACGLRWPRPMRRSLLSIVACLFLGCVLKLEAVRVSATASPARPAASAPRLAGDAADAASWSIWVAATAAQ